MYGILQQVTTDPLGSALSVDAAADDTVLTLDEIFEFDETGGEVLIDGVTYTYLSMDPDAQTLTLASGLESDQNAGTPVDLFSPEGSVAVRWIAWVDVEDSDQAIEAAIRTVDIPDYSPPGEQRAGTTVQLERDGAEGYVITSKVSELPVTDPVGQEPPDEALVVHAVGDALGVTAYTMTPISPSTVLDWFLDGVLIEEGTRATVIRIEAADQALVAGTDYSVTAQPRNGFDTGALSAPVVVQLQPDVTATTVLAWVAAGFILAGIIQVGAAMTFDATGITITHPDGRQTYMRADGSGNQFVGQATLDAATVLGVLALQGGATISSDATLLAGIADPSSKPGVTAAGWDSLILSSGVYGLNPRCLYDNGTTWYYIDTVFSEGNVNSINKTTGARTVVTDLPAKFNGYGGIAKVGSSWYVLGQDANRSYQWWVFIFNTSWVKTGEWRVTDAPSDHVCTLGVDGSGALLIARRSTSNNFTINVWSTAGVESAAAGTYPTWAGADLTGVARAAVDTATVRYVVTSRAHGTRVFNTSTAARVPGEEWTLSSTPLGISHDGTNWWTLDLTKVWKYTNLIGTWDFAFDLADTDTGGTSGAGTGLWGANTARTKRSSILTLAPQKRARWTISLPSAPPDDGTVDGTNTADLYAAPTGNTLVLQTTLADGVYSATYSTFASSGAAPSATSGFATRPGAVGRLVSAAVDDNGDPVIDVRGDGYSTLARTVNRPVVLRDNLDIDFTGTTDSATALQAAITAAGAGTPIEYGRQGVVRCDSGFNMLLFQELDMNTSSLGAGGTAPSELRFTNISSSGVGVTGYPGGNNVIKNGIIRGPGTGAGSSTGFLSASGSPRFHAVGFYGWAIGCSLTDAYYAKFFDECDFARNATGLLNSNCFNQDHFGSKFYSGYGASDASHGVGIDGGARALALHGGAIENFGASGGIKLYSGQVLDLFGPYFESSVAAGGFGINAGSTDKVTLNLYGCTVYLTELSRWAALSGATNMTINSAGQKFVGPSTSSTTPIAYVFNTTDVGNIQGRIGKDDWTEVAKGAYVPTAILNLGQIPDLDIRHPSRQYLGGDICGTGSPESVVPGRVGAIYRRLDGGATTSLYVKTSGTGTTGWTAK